MQHTNNLQLNISNRQILSIAVPIALAILVPQLNFIINNIFLGHLSQDSLAAAGITGVYYLVFAVIGSGLNNGLQALISRRAGENRSSEIGNLYIHGLFVSLAIAFAGIFISYTIGPAILKLSLHHSEILDTTTSFIKIRIWGLPFLFVYQMSNSLLVGTNNSRLLFYGTATEALVNIVLDYCLIFGHLGFTALGFNGAAYASIFAEFSGMIVVLLFIRFSGINKKFSFAQFSSIETSSVKLILVQSLPLVLQYGISIISWEFFYILIEHRGSTELAISNTMRNIFGLFGCITWAFASTCNTMVSNIIGQGKQQHVLYLVKRIATISVCASVFICIVINIFPTVLLGIYGQQQNFIIAAIPVLRIVSTALVLMSFSTVWLNAITGTGNTRVNLAIEILTICCYCLYVWLVLEKWNLPIAYGWMSEWLYWSLTFALSFIYMQNGKWANKKI